MCGSDRAPRLIGVSRGYPSGLTRHVKDQRMSTPMDAAEYRTALEVLQLTHAMAGAALGVTVRHSIRLASGQQRVSPQISKLLRLVLAGKVSIRDLREV
jgi:hypothetical protein